MKKIVLVIMSVLAMLFITEAQARSASYKVINVSVGDRLNIREGPSFRTTALSSMPYNARNIRVLLWAKEKTGKHYWVKIAWNDQFGWVNSYYLNAKKPKKKNQQIFRCNGTEPFWSANVYKNTMKVEVLGYSKFKAKVKFNGRPMNSPVGTRIVNARSKGHSAVLMTEKHYCSDGMSDEQYGYKAIMLVNGHQAYSGCCN